MCLLKKSLYGLKQTLHVCYQRVTDYVATMTFSHNIFDHSLFIYHNGNDMAYILLYVDDIILTTSSDSLCEYIMFKLSSKFAVNDLGRLSYFLGIYVILHSGGISLSHKRYA